MTRKQALEWHYNLNTLYSNLQEDRMSFAEKAIELSELIATEYDFSEEEIRTGILKL